MSNHSKHPFEPYVPKNATKLIIGTIPPARFCQGNPEQLKDNDVCFYYGSQDNAFWCLLTKVKNCNFSYSNNLESVEERKQFLLKNNLGIVDVIKECDRVNNRADDASLQNIVLNESIKDILKEHPSIDTLIYTSKIICKYINSGFADKSYHSWKIPNFVGSVIIGQKTYCVKVLYSPSPNALRGVSKEKRLKRYKEVFGD